jgi:MYXO-CTERM domain-containing protein
MFPATTAKWFLGEHNAMGIIEFHLHEPDFDFSPSMTTGRGSDDSKATDDKSSMDTKQMDLDTEWSPDEEESGRGVGKFLALAVLVGLGAILAMRRRSGGTDRTDELGTEDEVEVYN